MRVRGAGRRRARPKTKKARRDVETVVPAPTYERSRPLPALRKLESSLEAPLPSITTFLTYDDQAETAVRYYTSIFENSKIVNTMRAGDKVMSLTFELLGQTFMALNGGPTFSFAQGVSLFVSCDTQEQIDRYWNQLTDGGKPVQCGWLVDRFGVSWQIVPKILGDLLGDKDPQKAGRAMQAMLKMQKLDIAELKRAHAGT